jgi:dTDP-4-amino-4,6-dideoxygalactose transaminase
MDVEGVHQDARINARRIPLTKPDLPPFHCVEDSFREILGNGKITNFGKYITQLEQKARVYLGTHVATVSSGTLGLVFTLQALGLQPGGKVILPSFSFMATAQAILYAGGVPVFAEIGDDLTISPSDIELLLAQHPETAILLPVHIFGLPCRVDEIEQLVQKFNEQRSRPIALLYDAAHAFGATINGRRIGTAGDAEVFSLSVTKALVCVEGGMVSSLNARVIDRIRRMRNYGIEENYNAHWPGLNGKMSEFHAIIGLHNLRQLDRNLAVRAEKAAYFTQEIRQHTSFEVLETPSDVTHTFKDFTILVPRHLKAKRDLVSSLLGKGGIESRAYFCPPIHEQNYFRRFADRPLPKTEDLARRVITLPFFTTITLSEMDDIVAALARAERALA